MVLTHALFAAVAASVPLASAHIAFWDLSMYGFNVTAETFSYDNRPVAPLQDMTFDQWWAHGHLDFPPHPDDIFELPAGGAATAQLTCNKGLTSFFASSEGRTDVREGENPCPGDTVPSGALHTTGFDDLTGCALAIAYESDVRKIQPEDFAVFSVNHTCVWTTHTEFQVPERMPECPDGKCHCAWFWIHAPDGGSEQNYMNVFQCNVTGSKSDVALAEPKVPRRCGADPNFGKPEAVPGNCTYGAKQPFYWFQKERNNMFEGTFAPPFYTDLTTSSWTDGIPDPSPEQTVVPTLVLNPTAPATATASSIPASTTTSSALPRPSRRSRSSDGKFGPQLLREYHERMKNRKSAGVNVGSHLLRARKSHLNRDAAWDGY
ncbi:uncharacterized protein BXZ73DRAFT_73606 [Epithele typhae]|uniref:uncharacterized protein n=1 Tax=Epithele typhae TaxID=378194 RepID=UPI00200782A7|nr:uncharacterized protein BXZ73DRAFT_73606 [Epithele typhae]KAH9945461.1 hypothetical protein BXZ73DRAFT_73606 [Epithele typhae]